MRAFASTKTVPGVTPSSSAITVALDISFLELMARSGEGHPLRAGIAEAHQVAPSIVFEPIVQLLELNAVTSRSANSDLADSSKPSLARFCTSPRLLSASFRAAGLAGSFTRSQMM